MSRPETTEHFRAFVIQRYSDLLRTAYLLTGSQTAAEDLLQSSLLQVMGKWAKVEEPMAYLRRVMVNQRTSLWRRALRGVGLVHRYDDPSAPVDPDHAERVVLRMTLLGALDQMPPRTRVVLVLRYWEDLSEADTAATLGCSVGTVKSQASRGLARLRALLHEAGQSGHDLAMSASWVAGPARSDGGKY